MRVRPLLTPDPGVYVEAVHALVAGARTSLYVQTQYAHPSQQAGDTAFMELLAAVADRQKAGVDVRLIFSQWQTQPYLEKLQAAGIDLSGVRIQQGVHNKGIVVDQKTVLVSSQNWSTAGTLENRDAGVIIDSARVAAYYDGIFQHDWEHLATQHARED